MRYEPLDGLPVDQLQLTGINAAWRAPDRKPPGALHIVHGTRFLAAEAAGPTHDPRRIVAAGAALPLDVGSAGAVLREDADVLARGWAESVAQREAGVASVSAPVLTDDRVVAAVGVSGPIERLTQSPGERYAAAVTAAARRIERDARL